MISFREETLDLPGHCSPEGASHLASLLGAGLPRPRLPSHGVVHSLRDLYLNLLVCLVRPQPLTLDADHSFCFGSASFLPLRPPLSLWCPRGVDADPGRGWAGPRPRVVAGDAAHARVTPSRGQRAGVGPEAAVPVVPGGGHGAASRRLLGDRWTRGLEDGLWIILDWDGYRGRELAEAGEGGHLHDAGHGSPGCPGRGLDVHHGTELL